ncbi:MAG: hypothetical protein LBS68_03685 [Puniceicoccales bacterium]|nr:hypothetical protein [Puniceicoccales bacterium]
MGACGKCLRWVCIVGNLLSRWLGLRIWSDSLAGLSLLARRLRFQTVTGAFLFLTCATAISIAFLP